MCDSDRLHSITVKPVLECNARCIFCEQRRAHYKQAPSKDALSPDHWHTVINDSIQLGAEYVNISGGEPTLYRHLIDLVRHCKAHHLPVHLKSNGYLIDKHLAEKLAQSGLDSCTLSIYSHIPHEHDSLRGLIGSYAAAVSAVRHLNECGIRTCVQTILTATFLKIFQDYLIWASTLGINTLFLSYLEGGRATMRPSQDAIVTLDKSTKPRINHIIAELIKDDLLVSENIRQIDGLFAFENVSLSDMARGIYNPKSCRGCGRNRSMAMILANGEIHPCNAVEYFHEPIVGNVRDMSLIEAWHAAKWQDVRHNGLRVCNMCPMPRHVSIRFTQEAVSPFYSVPGDEQTSGTSIYD